MTTSTSPTTASLPQQYANLQAQYIEEHAEEQQAKQMGNAPLAAAYKELEDATLHVESIVGGAIENGETTLNASQQNEVSQTFLHCASKVEPELHGNAQLLAFQQSCEQLMGY